MKSRELPEQLRAQGREAAPVVLYVTDQDMRTRKKIEEILKGRDIPYLVNDVTDDEASRSWALRELSAGSLITASAPAAV